jgi:hypothetical protein
MNKYDITTSVNLLRAILWQYNDAKALQSLLAAKQEWHKENVSDFWQNWYRDVFDLRTANDFGLSIWAEILGIKTVASIPPTNINKANFGFGATNKNFDNGTFGQIGYKNKYLKTSEKRLLLRLRYLTLIARNTVPEINKILYDVFHELGTVYVSDSYDMNNIVYLFTYLPTSEVRFLLDNFDILPRPATVGANYNIVTRAVFGFGEYNRNFNNATFKGAV